jgi:peptidyl-Lys metalloendopeptidase
MATTLDCKMSVPPSLKAGEPVQLKFQLTNTTAQPLFVLNWNTPLEGLFNSYLQVTRDGTDVPYQGPMFKRANPEAKSYVTVPAGKSVEGSVEASLAYDFKQPGHYRIAFRNELLDVTSNQSEVPRPLDRFQPMSVKCPAVETTIVTP